MQLLILIFFFKEIIIFLTIRTDEKLVRNDIKIDIKAEKTRTCLYLLNYIYKK